MFKNFKDSAFSLEKIAGIKIKMVDIPFQDDFTISGGTSGTSFNPILIHVTDKSGNSGISTLDNFPNSSYDGNSTSVSWVSLKEYIPILLSKCNKEGGCSIFDVHQVLHEIRDYNPFAVSALEMACFDLLGKKQDRPCYELFLSLFNWLLSEYSDEQIKHLIPDKASLKKIRDERLKNGFDSKISIGLKERYFLYDASIHEALKKGINAVKLKITPEPKYNRGLVEYVRDTFPEITIDTDANSCFVPRKDVHGNYSISEIVEIYNSMEQFKIRMHEQPSYFKDDHLELFEKLLVKIKTPLCPDESLYGFYEARQFCEISRNLQKPFFLNIKVHRSGGLITCIRILTHVFMHNMQNPKARVIPWGGYMPDQENSTNALLHLFTLPVETSHTDATSHDYWFKNSIFNKTMDVEKGKVKIINGPGFGLDVDDDTLKNLLIKEKAFS